ncbi:MAG TPA: hypothetical protein VGG28_26180 [Kofleriaceae bacterium]|jgi:flagellar hook-associated protein 3 FlgL
MRVTNMYMVDMAQQANAKNQSTVAQLSQEVSSGLAVAKPSDDPVKWMEAQREKVRSAINDGTGEALQSGIEKLTATDGALSTLSGLVSQAQSLAVEGASANITSDARANEAQQISGMVQSALAALNTKDVDGTYLLAGTSVNTTPFDSGGNYAGNSSTTSINSSSSDTSQSSLAGSSLSSSVNIISTLNGLVTALNANDTTGIQTALGSLNTAVTQMATTRAQVGGMMASLQSAQSAQQSLTTSLASSISNYTEVDAVQSASSLAQASTVLQVSQSVTQKVLELLTPETTS